ncbi:MAG: ATP-binding cassette domain-containing protein [Rickettsiales bacterium]|jgi:ATPase subunit of ABC transporter with duplicated ATPase domains|nr:ATP-binding cassette domain-containing protein [Rickettsiales bacterium]
MPIISVDNIKYENGKGVLFKDASFSINEDDRIGIVGNNGSGKSTLVKCLTGELEFNGGKICIKRGTRIGYVEQDLPKALENETLYNLLKLSIPEDERDYSVYKIDTTLETFEVPKEFWDREVSKLSGGWRRLALIARSHLNNPDLLILDEPTNHLDLGKILYLERWLREVVCDTPYIVISHDREFLDNCTNKTIVLRDGNIYFFKHSYTEAMNLLVKQDKADERKRKIQERDIDRLSKTMKDFKQKGQAHGSERLTRIAKTIETRINRIEENLVNTYREDRRNIGLGDNEIDYRKPILKINNLDIKTPDGKLLFNIDSLEISRGERLFILGMNGAGKSLLIKRIMYMYKNTKSPYYVYGKDDIVFNPRVEIGYIDQNLSILPPDETIQNFIRREFGFDLATAISSLTNIGFPHEIQNTLIKNLSFGEKTRLSFLKLKH